MAYVICQERGHSGNYKRHASIAEASACEHRIPSRAICLVNIHTTIMKERITYVVTKPESFDPGQIAVQKDGGKNGDTFTLNGVVAAKEHRITLGLDDLSQWSFNM